MKMKSFKRVLAMALATAMILTACGQKPAANTSESTKASESAPAKESEVKESEAATETVIDKDKLPVITMYPANANLFSGLVTGHRSDFFAQYGFQLEVWAHSEEKTTAMLTSGDFPDMMYIDSFGVDGLETLIDTDKIINYDDYKEYLPNFFEDPYNEYVEDNFDRIRENWSAGTGGLYLLPWQLGTSSNIYAQTSTFDRNVPKLKWDVYEAIGAPEITDLWQLIDIAEDMLEYQQVDENGNKMYGTFLDTGMSGDRFGGMYLWYSWHGYAPSMHGNLCEVDLVNGTVESILEEDSLYKEGVRWYNEIYRRGLLDPDSISTDRNTQGAKIDEGLAMLPTGTLPGWPTKYYEVFVPGTTVYFDYTREQMAACMGIVINKDSEYIEECLAFVNMLADPYCWLNINYGPEGVMWETEGNVMSITDEFAAWLKEKGNVNFFPMGDGTEWNTWNTSIPIMDGTPIKDYVDINGEPLCALPTLWPDAQAITTDAANWTAWKETMDAEDLWDYCEKNDITVYQVNAFEGVVTPTPSDEMALTKATIKDIIVPATWKMIYAETEAEFDQLWNQMVKDAMDLGAQDVIDWFKENYKPNN